MTGNTAWFPLWIADYIADTTHLSCEQHGAYFLLMLAYYQRGRPLPDDDGHLSGIAHCQRRSWRYLRPVVAEFFHIENGLWHHKRIDAELAEQFNRAAKRSEAASELARKRWAPGYSKDNATKSTGDDMRPACAPHANGAARERKPGYSHQKSTKSTDDDMPPACGTHTLPNLQKKLAITKNAGLVDPNLNDFNAPNMLHLQGRSLLFTEQRDLPPHARDATPPLPSQGDGDAALRAVTIHKVEAEAPTKEEGAAAFQRCIDAINGKLGVFDSGAGVPPPDPRLTLFRARLSRLNTIAGTKLRGELRMQAWEVLAVADSLADPRALSPAMLADLDAIERLGQPDQWTEAAE